MVLGTASRAATPAAAVDLTALGSLIGSAPCNFTPLVELCERDFPKAMGDLRAAVAAHDPGKARGAAHSLKGMLLNLCAHQGSSLAAEVEQLVHAGTFVEAARRMDGLEAELTRVTTELRAYSKS